MALPGSRQAAIGNNPLSFVAPGGEGKVPLVVDLATSAVAQGKIIEAARSGKPIPEGWAIDPDGQPTTNAAAALRGFLMPASAHKGIGLAFMVEVLAGALTGTRPVKSMTSSGPALPPAFGAFVMVVNPAAFGSREAFDAYLAQSVAIYRKSGPDARYPGESSAALERERMQNGIVLSDALVRDLQSLGEQCGIPFPSMGGA
jgi:LDH2 family malate/lactate/ureidoglycolate dehydrogenase